MSFLVARVIWWLRLGGPHIERGNPDYRQCSASCLLYSCLNVLFISWAHAVVILDEMTALSHLLSSPQPPAAPPFFLHSSLTPTFAFLALPFSSLCFASVGTRNEQLPGSDWVMYEVIRWDESVHNSKDMKQKRRGKNAAQEERRWNVLTCAFEREKMRRNAADAGAKQWEQVTVSLIPQPWHTSAGKLSHRSHPCIFCRSRGPSR